MKVGWEFVTWSGEAQPCAVAPCGRLVNAGHVRVDRAEPAKGDAVICADCYFKIMLGVDPDPGALVPAWEEERRAQADPDTA